MMLLALALLSPANAAEPAADLHPAPSTTVEVQYLAVVADDAPAEDSGTGEDEEDQESVKAEKDAVRSSKSETANADDGKKRRRVIKVIEKKTFMKIGRYEVGPQIGFVTNDPFLNRYILGVTLDYHVTEIFAVQVQVDYSPILGEEIGEGDPDSKALTKQLLNSNSVTPDLSKLDAMGSAALAPIYGKAAVGRNIIAFDIFGAFGLGVIHTQDDALALQTEPDNEEYLSTASEWHPTTVISGGARVAFSETVAARLEGKATSYIETIMGGTLEMKNNFILQGGVTFFFPNMK